MTSIIDTASFDSNIDTSGERFIFSKKRGKLTLRVKSPLFEEAFKISSGGEISPATDPVWGARPYVLKLDRDAQRRFQEEGIFLAGLDRVWHHAIDGMPNVPTLRRETPGIVLNFGFLLIPGIKDGMTFPLRDTIPLSLIEGPDYRFTNGLKRGLYTLLKHFVFDYELDIQIKVDQKGL